MVKTFITLAHSGKHQYRSNLLWYFNPIKSRVNITMVIYWGIWSQMFLSKKAIMVLQQWAVMNKQIPWLASEARGLYSKIFILSFTQIHPIKEI